MLWGGWTKGTTGERHNGGRNADRLRLNDRGETHTAYARRKGAEEEQQTRRNANAKRKNEYGRAAR